MSDQSRISIGRSMAVFAVVTAVIGNVWLAILGYGENLWIDWVIHNGIIAVGSAVVAWLVLPAQPRNAVIWVFAWSGVLTGLLCVLAAVVLAGVGAEGSIFDLVPAEMPIGYAIAAMNANWLWTGIFLPFTLGLLLFPDGRPPTPRWRWLTWAVIAAFGALNLGLAIEARPSSTLTLAESQDTAGGFRSIGSSLATLGYPLMFLLAIVCVAALIARFRRSTGVVRQQFRWVVWGAAVAGFLMAAAFILDEILDRLDFALATGVVSFSILMASLGIAIAKYRIYDIDAVISRTFVYTTLAAFISTVYVGIVVGLGVLFGAADEPNPVLGIAATVIIALAFQPMRRSLQRVANRLVYGKRASRYEVLSTFAQRVDSLNPEVLGQIARSLQEGTAATAASIWTDSDAGLHLAASWPEGSAPDTPNSGHQTDVVHNGERLGIIELDVEAEQTLSPTDLELMEQVASGLGLALRNLRLTEALQSRVAELRESRRRIVALQDETRHDLERNLHDGAQQRLVALKIKLGIGVTLAEQKDLTDIQEMLASIHQDTDETIQTVRDFARGIYPPLLETEGLEQALAAHARRAPLPVSVQAAGVGRYPPGIEATVYFCVLEAIQNAVAHSSAKSVSVNLSDNGQELSFEVRDDGVGFDPEKLEEKFGLLVMEDRLDTIGGSLAVSSGDGRGTSVVGVIPVLELVAT